MKHTVEFVQWDLEKIRETAVKIITYYKQGLGYLAVGMVGFAASRLDPVLRGSEGEPAAFRRNGFELIYRGPSYNPTPRLQDNGDVLWMPREPGFTVGIDTTVTRPRLWTMIEQVNGQIGDEAKKSHGLVVADYPFSIKFPKETYAKNYQIIAGLPLNR